MKEVLNHSSNPTIVAKGLIDAPSFDVTSRLAAFVKRMCQPATSDTPVKHKLLGSAQG